MLCHAKIICCLEDEILLDIFNLSTALLLGLLSMMIIMEDFADLLTHFVLKGTRGRQGLAISFVVLLRTEAHFYLFANSVCSRRPLPLI